MRRIGICLALACAMLLILSGLAAAQGPHPYGWPGYYTDPGYAAGYYYGYGNGYYQGYQYGYQSG